jgi:hypothetical protein
MNAAAGIEILLSLLDRAATWGAVVQKARMENRAITEAEIDAFFAADDAADKRLADAIARAKAEGR